MKAVKVDIIKVGRISLQHIGVDKISIQSNTVIRDDWFILDESRLDDNKILC